MSFSEEDFICDESCFQRAIDLGDDESVPSDFFFEHFTSESMEKITAPLTNAKNYIITKASNFLGNYVEFVSADFTNHLHNIYNHFRLDEELFLFSLIVLHRYVKITRKALQLKRDSELFYLLILCIIISFKCILDVPIDNGKIARSLNLDAGRLQSNEGQILTALQFNVFFHSEDIRELGSVFPLEALSLLSYSADVGSEKARKEREKVLNAWMKRRLQKTPPALVANAVRPLSPPTPVSAGLPVASGSVTDPAIANPISPAKIVPNSLSPEPAPASAPPEEPVSVSTSSVVVSGSLTATQPTSKSVLSLNAKPFIPQAGKRTKYKKTSLSDSATTSDSSVLVNTVSNHHLHTQKKTLGLVTDNTVAASSDTSLPFLPSMPVRMVPPFPSFPATQLPPPPPPALLVSAPVSAPSAASEPAFVPAIVPAFVPVHAPIPPPPQRSDPSANDSFCCNRTVEHMKAGMLLGTGFGMGMHMGMQAGVNMGMGADSGFGRNVGMFGPL